MVRGSEMGEMFQSRMRPWGAPQEPYGTGFKEEKHKHTQFPQLEQEVTVITHTNIDSSLVHTHYKICHTQLHAHNNCCDTPENLQTHSQKAHT